MIHRGPSRPQDDPETIVRYAFRMFANVESAQRIEAAVCRLLEESAAAAAVRRPAARVFVRTFAGGVAVYAGEGSPLNKIAGLGFGGAVDEDALVEIEREYAARGSPVQAELSTLGDPGIGTMLSRRGYVLTGHENVLGMALRQGDDRSCARDERDVVSSSAAADPGIEIRLSDESDFDIWLDTVMSGFAAPDAQGVASHESFAFEVIRNCMQDMCATAGFSRYLARRVGEPAGGGSLYTGAGIGQLCGAATLPRHRRRGVQAALFESRLRDAAKLGCDLAVITTMPGSKSQENAQRRGFSLLYSRAVMVKGL